MLYKCQIIQAFLEYLCSFLNWNCSFKQEKADDSNTMHYSYFYPNNDMEIHWGRFGWRKLPIWLLPAALCQHRHKQDATHYWGSKRSSILRKKSPVERNIVRWNTGLNWIAWLYRHTCVQLSWIQNLKMAIFFCLNMLEICIPTIFEAKWSLRDPAVFQPFGCVSNVALSGRANTAAAVIVHFEIHFVLI